MFGVVGISSSKNQQSSRCWDKKSGRNSNWAVLDSADRIEAFNFIVVPPLRILTFV